MSMTARTMPLRQDRNAPRFEGDATLLSRYLEDIEEITEACGKVGEQIRYAKYFCDLANERVFQSVEVETPGMNWAEFRRALAERYTVQEEERRRGLSLTLLTPAFVTAADSRRCLRTSVYIYT